MAGGKTEGGREDQNFKGYYGRRENGAGHKRVGIKGSRRGWRMVRRYGMEGVSETGITNVNYRKGKMRELRP
jgi:hypothetical protein